jgi:hypothetical protein
LKEVLSYIKNPLFQWQKPGYEDKRLLLNIFFSEKIVYNREYGFQTHNLPLILALSTQANTPKSNLVEMAGVKPASKEYHLNN